MGLFQSIYTVQMMEEWRASIEVQDIWKKRMASYQIATTYAELRDAGANAKELADMEERGQRERELELKNKADDHDAANNDGNADGGGSATMDVMEVEEAHAAQQDDLSTQRIQTFQSILGQHVVANLVDRMSITEIEQLVNREAALPYTRNQISSILERMQEFNRILMMDGIIRII